MDTATTDRNSRLVIDQENHLYIVDGKPMEFSVTELIHKYFDNFNGPVVAKKMVENPQFRTDPKYKRYWSITAGLSKEEAVVAICNEWKSANTANLEGTAMHANIEEYLISDTPIPDSAEKTLFLRYHEDMLASGFITFRSEQAVYDEEYDLGGSVDMLYTRPEWLDERPVKAVLCDWKRSKEIKFHGFAAFNKPPKCGRGLCADIEDCNFQHYSLQLNIYKHLLEKHYNMKIVKMEIVVIFPSWPCPQVYPVTPNEELAIKMCKRVNLPPADKA